MTIQKDPVSLKKIRELVTYLFPETTDADYISLNELFVAIDSSNELFNSTLPKKISLSEIVTGAGEGSSLHYEGIIATGLSNTSWSEDFDTAFTDVPVGRQSIYVYKVDGDGYDYPYLIKNITITNSNISFTFEDVSGETITDFTGIIIQYLFFEAT